MKKLILIPYEKYARLFSPPEERLERLEPMDTKKENKLSDQDILSLLPEKLRDKGKQFLHFLKTEPSIDWDEKGRVIIDGDILNFSHITDFLKDTLQPGKPIEHLESWYAKLSDSVPLSLVHAQRRPYVIKDRDLEKKGFGNRKDQAKINLQDHPSQEPAETVQEPVEPVQELVEPVEPLKPVKPVEPVEPVVKPVQARLQGASQEVSENSQPIIIPPGIPDKSPKNRIKI